MRKRKLCSNNDMPVQERNWWRMRTNRWIEGLSRKHAPYRQNWLRNIITPMFTPDSSTPILLRSPFCNFKRLILKLIPEWENWVRGFATLIDPSNSPMKSTVHNFLLLNLTLFYSYKPRNRPARRTMYAWILVVLSYRHREHKTDFDRSLSMPFVVGERIWQRGSSVTQHRFQTEWPETATYSLLKVDLQSQWPVEQVDIGVRILVNWSVDHAHFRNYRQVHRSVVDHPSPRDIRKLEKKKLHNHL